MGRLIHLPAIPTSSVLSRVLFVLLYLRAASFVKAGYIPDGARSWWRPTNALRKKPDMHCSPVLTIPRAGYDKNHTRLKTRMRSFTISARRWPVTLTFLTRTKRTLLHTSSHCSFSTSSSTSLVHTPHTPRSSMEAFGHGAAQARSGEDRNYGCKICMSFLEIRPSE